MQAGGLFNQIQPQAGATLAAVRAGGGIKTLEHAGLCVVRDACAFVANPQFDLAVLLAQVQMNGAACGAEVDGVVEQVQQGLVGKLRGSGLVFCGKRQDPVFCDPVF